MNSTASKRNSVSPPNWEQSSEEDQPLDFSRSTSDDHAESKLTNGKTPNSVTSTQSSEEACSTARMFLQSTSPRGNISPQTASSDISDAEPSDVAASLPSNFMFARSTLPPTLSPSELLPGHDILNPAFNPLYQFAYRPALPQLDATLLRGNGGFLDPEYLRFRQQALSQRIQQLGRRKLGRVSPSPPPNTISPPEITREMSEHSNDSQHISTSSSTPGSVTPTRGQTAGRRRGKAYPEEKKDAAYYERRRKNNEAAKRSRDARRAKEDETAIRAAFLEEENLKLRVANAALETELQKLRCIVYARAD
ncbi:uncharacterized protein LOC108865199 [Galendromus occidentalis]|uniref:Uncharacterized protein LOC108865199 n=1 Tax=Galendromus occidentalis TaxID=34638 RepID=A0AAJ7L8T5_9ACAR|nr:uncharacterized protein LOC108865199 [Galendromus occidentalis]